ncbi:hypothetical protein VQ02_12715 [Methylobacterium variabile]|uniref:Uncharacterized protein n=2 Tax=Methylobacterium TaxID=407 RepID=A0A0J6SVQ6_9HYPH|nr:hypothetical protein VP06_08120 [Methylobacterium aquaticum]KMO37794.1 hypothetical protein VQ02_12715 [Methylobacterium variabile]
MPTLQGHLLQAITDQKGRNNAALAQVHEVLKAKEHLAAATSALAEAAQKAHGLRFPDYAWLRHVDPILQSKIATY